MFEREFLRRAVEGPYRHQHAGFGFRLHHNRVRYPGLLAVTAAEAYRRVASYLSGVVLPPTQALDLFVRSRRRRRGEARAAFLSRTPTGRPALFLNLHNRERLPLDSVFFWELVRAALAHEFAHAFVHAWTGGRPLPAWMDEGTARFVERQVAPRASLARGGPPARTGACDSARGGEGHDEAAHRVVLYIVGRFGLVAWFDSLAEVSRYLQRQRGRIRAARRRRHADRVNRGIDALLVRRFGLDRSGIAERLAGRGGRERPVEVEPSAFDLVLAGKIGASRGTPLVQVALALLFRPACHDAPVVTSLARSPRAVRRLFGRARREGRAVVHDPALAFRLATGRLLYRPIPEPFRPAVLALGSARGTRRSRSLRQVRLWRVEGDGRAVGVAAFANGLAVRVDRPPRGNRSVTVRSPSLARRIAESALSGDCLPSGLLQELVTASSRAQRRGSRSRPRETGRRPSSRRG